MFPIPLLWWKVGIFGTVAIAAFAYVFHLGNAFGSNARSLARINAATEEANRETEANNAVTEQAIRMAEEARKRLAEELITVPDLPQCAVDCSITLEARERLNGFR